MKRTFCVCLFLCLTTTCMLSQSSPAPQINQAARVVAPIFSASQPSRVPVQLAELTADINNLDSSALGTSIATNGNTVVASAPGTNNEGVVFLYVEPIDGWANMTQPTLLYPGPYGNHFGTSVAISSDGNTVFVGYLETGFNDGLGQVFVFVKPQGGWPSEMVATAELSASDGTANANLGTSISVSGNADLKSGDVIIAIDGHYIYTIDDLRTELLRHEQGARLAIRYRRNRLTYDNYLALSSQDAGPRR